MNKSYFIDVLLRGYPPGEVDSGEEPIITVIRVAVDVPEGMPSEQLSVAIGEQVREIGVHIAENSEEIAGYIDRYEEAVAEMMADPEAPPDSRPN